MNAIHKLLVASNGKQLSVLACNLSIFLGSEFACVTGLKTVFDMKADCSRHLCHLCSRIVHVLHFILVCN